MIMDERLLFNKYQIIVNDLSKEIREGKYITDAPVPSETKLMQQYSVSRITARKALDIMTSMGLIYKIQGKGCYVAKGKRSHSLLVIHSYKEEIINAGLIPSRKLLGSGVFMGSPEICMSLSIPDGSEIFEVERVIYADNDALCLVTSYLSRIRFPEIEVFDFSRLSLYEILESQYGLKISRTVLKIDAVNADSSIAEKMGIQKGFPLLYLSIIAYCTGNNQDIPIELSHSYYNPSIINYTISKPGGF